MSLIALLPVSWAAAQSQPPSEKFQITARTAYTWPRAGTTFIELQGPLTIALDRASLSADDAVLWLSPASGGAPGQQYAEFELLGNARVEHQGVATFTGDHLYFTAEVLGDPQINVQQRVARDMSGTPLYQRAAGLRQEALRVQATRPTLPPVILPTTAPSQSRPSVRRPPPTAKVHLEAGQSEPLDTEEGNVALVAWDGARIRVVQESTGEAIEMQAQRAVLFTTLQSLRDVSKQQKAQQARDQVSGIYLEGDARIDYEPNKPGINEQRLLAASVYYDVATDRALLVNVVLHTIDPTRAQPFIVRAKIMYQLSKGEYDAKDVQITSSAFAVPSYSLAADRLYVRSEQTGDPQFPSVINFDASSVTFQAFDVPFFYLPFASGSIGDRPGALRGIGFGHRSDLGYSFLTEWGLFETLGQVPPRDLDAGYRLDYFTDRGPAVGLNAAWGGGLVTEPAHQAWNFLGNLRSYFVYDRGRDENYGRLPVKPGGPGDTPRGFVLFQHQHFFPNDWQAQIRLGYVSDPTFQEEWFPWDFYERGPIDVSGYIKRQRDTEAFTLLAEAQPSRLVTTSDRAAEQFEVERLPELGYHRIGDSILGDGATFFSDNSGGALDFQPTRATLRQQGYAPPTITPGIPALGLTGVTTSTVWRGDFRQELDFPIHAGAINVVPYLVGRYTEYSNSPEGAQLPRFFGALGARLNTSFWKIDRSAQSDLFDIHQIRHVIEPELNVFTSGTTVDRSRLFAYDVPVDEINDISAVEVGMRQRWQTLRGGPGRWRSVDAFTLDLDAEFYANKPPRRFLQPFNFRGVFYPTLPEASVPRDAANANASWRISDNTVILADAQYNIDESKLATAAAGVLVRRDIYLAVYLGNRYIADLNSNITSIQANYQLSPKYTLAFGQDFDFGLGKNVSSSIAVVRTFDRFIMVIQFYHQQIGNQTGFNFNIYPIGLGAGIGTSALQGPFNR